MTKHIGAGAAFAALALIVAPLDADAGSKKPVERHRLVERDCRPFNGPMNYYGNPWCDGGYKYAEDWAPGTGGYLDVFDLPQVQRLRRRFD